MKHHVMEPLLYVISRDGRATLVDIGEAFAARGRGSSAADYGRELVRWLVQFGALSKLQTGVYGATEKGRIAAALFMAKYPSFRHAYFDEEAA